MTLWVQPAANKLINLDIKAVAKEIHLCIKIKVHLMKAQPEICRHVELFCKLVAKACAARIYSGDRKPLPNLYGQH